MNRKYLFIIIACVLAVAVIYCLNIPGEIHRINTNVPAGFLYQNSSEDIPASNLIQQRFPETKNISTYLSIKEIYSGSKWLREDYVCLDTGEVAQLIEYYYYASATKEGADLYRYALVCGNDYFIVDYNDPLGQRFYGPFNISQ